MLLNTFFRENLYEVMESFRNSFSILVVIFLMGIVTSLASWMDLATLVRYNFPLLESDDELEKYKETVIKNINRKSAICALIDYEVVGILLFSYNQNCLPCLAVHPEHPVMVLHQK